ncbi:LOW QUALITY PROTEIN: FAD-dependent oxidoreductase domain-containing protein 1 [Lethenteron reissneri]|uniref:LOW QUALITY PROTEIN: FAD-dependent oxidoreductase domain-containing protein 1 n=1 Tax=Lethenteron reissneri TaxID=7753 RepID=UPI002AB630BA|nr:LOW QUALITY PROTEIN: FAD-dependent oxidoreductase domain-containing protein 1 [Lethenteron reissneri]
MSWAIASAVRGTARPATPFGLLLPPGRVAPKPAGRLGKPVFSSPPPPLAGRVSRLSSWRRFPAGVGDALDSVRTKVGALLPEGDVPTLCSDGNLPELPPEETDVVVVGGGVMGWSTAYWLARKGATALRKRQRVLLVEKDPQYKRASSVLAAGGIRQQFSLPENIHMSMYGAFFLRNIKDHLTIPGEDPPEVFFNPSGYLMLAGEKEAANMEEKHRNLLRENCKVDLLSPTQLKTKFPWINTEGIALATYGLENEGWFDPWALLQALRRKALSMGVYYYNGEVTGFKFSNWMGNSSTPIIHKVYVMAPHSRVYQPVDCSMVVNATGAWMGQVARMAALGSDAQGLGAYGRVTHTLPDTRPEFGPLLPQLPIGPRKRYVFVFHCPDGPGLDCPLVVDPSGAYFRREGITGNYIGGMSPPPDEEPSVDNLDVDYDYFQEKVWPLLAHRVPAFQSLKVHSAWAGYYEHNEFDSNGVIGFLPEVPNLLHVGGFSGHGLQHAAAAGRAAAEILADGELTTLDLRRLTPTRILDGEPLLEDYIV